jgi:hypothetical protein
VTESRHRFADLIVGADFPLPELPNASGRPAMTVTMAERRRTDARRNWRHRWREPGGREWMRVARDAGGCIVQYPGGAEFHLRDDEITCHPRAGVPARTVRHLLLDLLLPAVMASRGHLVLHASAVAVDGRALGFMGIAGAGKSTVAGALTRHGASTLTDDALVLDVHGPRAMAIPTYPGLRLWPESRALFKTWTAIRRTRVNHNNRKERWSGANVPFARGPAALDALYLLARGRRVDVRPVPPVEAMMALVRFSMMLDPTDRVAVGRGFELAARLVEHVPIRRLVVPRRPSALVDVCHMLIADGSG